MARKPTIAEQEIIWPPQYQLGLQRLANIHLADYWAVTKPEVNLLTVITTFAGFWLSSSNRFHHVPFMLLVPCWVHCW
jgi:heme O synthase-like polyprenyltransferase